MNHAAAARIVIAVVATVLLGASAPESALARGRSRTSAKAKAKRFFRKGKRLFKRGKYARAIAFFKKAYRFRPHPVIQYNIAIAYSRLDKNVEALKHLHIYLKGADATDPKLPVELKLLKQKVGSILVVVPNPKAKIFIDGRFVGQNKVKLYFEPGKRVVEIRLDNRIVATRVITVEGGQEKVWEITPASLERPRPRPRRPHPPPLPNRPPAPRSSAPSRARWRSWTSW